MGWLDREPDETHRRNPRGGHAPTRPGDEEHGVMCSCFCDRCSVGDHCSTGRRCEGW